MTPDDPRHGTNAGYVQGCRRDCCKVAHAAYRRSLRARRYLERTERFYIDATGTHRRIRALMALGWRLSDLDQALGHPPRSSYTYNLLAQRRVHLTTATSVTEVYDRLSMKLGPSERVRSLARVRAWAPPLAWDDDKIDDPQAVPHGIGAATATRGELLRELDGDFAGITRACRSLQVTRTALEKWCVRHEMTDLFSRLVARESPRFWRNGVAEGGAA